MEIDDKALDAAVRALFEDGCGEPKVDAATMLEAAAPYIAGDTRGVVKVTVPNN